jgi:hypothetical protein
MATTPADLTDATFRNAMQHVEKLIDDGEYGAACRAAGETYLTLLERRPELVAGASTDPHTPTGLSRATTWPPNGGVLIGIEDGKPALVLAKERFSMSEAYGYFEFLMNLLWTLQKETPGGV